MVDLRDRSLQACEARQAALEAQSVRNRSTIGPEKRAEGG